MINSLTELRGLMRQHGVIRIYVKLLAPNDNSKNQIYLGGNFTVLNIIPHGEVLADGNKVAGSVRDRAKSKVKLSWIERDGVYEADNTQLILYPKYPEVRLSGFLKGCKKAPSEIMRSRQAGRMLFLGITRSKNVLAHASSAESALTREVHSIADLKTSGVLLQLPDINGYSSKEQLLSALSTVFQKQWINSQKLGKDGQPQIYSARNGGGYTLEAELGISPNGNSEPDFLGWEIKQYGVSDFVRFSPKGPITLLTPEPTGGIYRDLGMRDFMHRYGYADRAGIVGRINFGGRYFCDQEANKLTGLTLRMTGYDSECGKITDLAGGLALLDKNENVAAFWGFTQIIEHWNRKHAQAAYLPSLFRTPPPQYKYAPQVLLCEGTDLVLFLRAIASGKIYLDPALKFVTHADGKVDWKKRNQFRLKHSHLGAIYHSTETVSLNR
jgi:MvaI/BcnI restriction endonuclease family